MKDDIKHILAFPSVWKAHVQKSRLHNSTNAVVPPSLVPLVRSTMIDDVHFENQIVFKDTVKVQHFLAVY